MSFIELCLSGEVLKDEIDNFVDKWHEGVEGQDEELYEYLGLTWYEYSLWATKPSILGAILVSRKRGINLDDELNQERFALAARAETAREAELMTQWLKRIGKL